MTNQINWTLFERTLAAIKANPEHWDQGDWHCGTSHCFAGFAQVLSLQDAGDLPTELDDCDEESVYEASGCAMNTLDIAKELLSVSEDQSDWLFSQNRSIEEFELCLQRKAIPSFGEDYCTVWP